MEKNPMTDPELTPPPELVQQWIEQGVSRPPGTDYMTCFATLAARWGADQELEACCEWINSFQTKFVHAHDLRLVRRPKPPSLKEQALESVKRFEKSGEFFSDQMRELEFIRKALETIDD
jgi:hypothetical protein